MYDRSISNPSITAAKEKKYRKPIGISQSEDNEGIHRIVVCDDGSLWVYSDRRWFEASPIPGTERAADHSTDARY